MIQRTFCVAGAEPIFILSFCLRLSGHFTMFWRKYTLDYHWETEKFRRPRQFNDSSKYILNEREHFRLSEQFRLHLI